jgi:hypothetical protein
MKLRFKVVATLLSLTRHVGEDSGTLIVLDVDGGVGVDVVVGSVMCMGVIGKWNVGMGAISSAVPRCVRRANRNR